MSLGVVYFASWNYWVHEFYPLFPHVGTCAGEPYAAVAGCMVLTSYLFLFILFYISTYNVEPKKLRGEKVDAKCSTQQQARQSEKKTL